MKKPPLGPIPWLPARRWCENHTGSRYEGPPCPNCVPVNDGHNFVLATASLDELREFWTLYLL